MSIVGRLHPLLIHFPIALVIGAAVAEAAALLTANSRWRTVAISNTYAGAVCAVAAVVAGWRLAAAPAIEPSAALEWHRWIGVGGTVAALAAAVAAGATRRSAEAARLYRTALFAAAALIAAAGHIGGLLVWGGGFLRP